MRATVFSVCTTICLGMPIPLVHARAAAASPADADGGAASAVRHVVSSRDEPAHVIAGGKGLAQLLINTSTGAKDIALSIVVLAPGATVAEHVHATSSETLFLEAGSVEMTIAGKRTTANAGDAIYIPAGVPHSARVVGRVQPVRAIQIYAGPGPEQRFAVGKQVPPES